MGNREKVASETQTKVLTESRRRCAFCFGLKNDMSEKKGQIAHVDRDRSNSTFENLAWLCLDHHAEYDSRTSQNKGLSEKELLAYRDSLYEAIRADPRLLAFSEFRKTVPKSTPETSATSKPIALDVYDRRIKIYHVARDFIGSVSSLGAVEKSFPLKFARDCEEALFLFDDEIAGILWDIYRHAIRMRTIQHVLPYTPVGARRDALVEEAGENEDWIVDQCEVLREKMKHYLRLS